MLLKDMLLLDNINVDLRQHLIDLSYGLKIYIMELKELLLRVG